VTEKNEFENFSALTKRLLSVPKAEIDGHKGVAERKRPKTYALRKPARAAFLAVLATVLSRLAVQ
jgi:hypothetical protein